MSGCRHTFKLYTDVEDVSISDLICDGQGSLIISVRFWQFEYCINGILGIPMYRKNVRKNYCSFLEYSIESVKRSAVSL